MSSRERRAIVAGEGGCRRWNPTPGLPACLTQFRWTARPRRCRETVIMARIATINRTTSETDIALTLNLDGTGVADIATGIGFLDHMLTALARHGLFDLTIRVRGDL